MNKTLVLVRHAHREKIEGNSDNGISPKGRKQARALATWFEREFSDSAILIVTSPKKRCIETVAPLTQEREANTAIIDELDEGGDIAKKARRFVRWWKMKAPLLTVACSHGDILPAVLGEFIGDSRLQMSKGSCAVVELEGRAVVLTHLEQSPK